MFIDRATAMPLGRASSALLVACLLAGGAEPLDAATISVPAAKDNTLCQSAAGTLSNGAGSYLFVGRTDDSSLRRGLISFDLLGVPAGSVVTGATLVLNMSRTRAAATPITVHRVAASWGEAGSKGSGEEGGCATAMAGDATWTQRSAPATPWASAGGDFAGVASATTSVGGNGSYMWSGAGLVADVQAWVDDPTRNFGWLLRGSEGADKTAKRFDTRQNPDPAVRPMLIVDYTPASSGPIVYEHTSEDPCTIIAPANNAGSGPSPVPVTPSSGAVVYYYQVDLDGSCTTSDPPLLKLVKTLSGLNAHF